jgi:hypothetical protein
MVMPVKTITGNNQVSDLSVLPPALYIVNIRNEKGENVFSRKVILKK